MSEITLDQLVTVSPRFVRSVSLVRDAQRKDALDGYILTPTGREVIRRLAESLRDNSLTRAWSLTGPYGTGKSSFALFIAQLLSGEEGIRQHARKLLSTIDPDLTHRLFGAGAPLFKRSGRLCPVLVTGSRQPLKKALARSLADSLRALCGRGRPPQLVEQLERLSEESVPSGASIVGLFEEANYYLERFGKDASGILLIVDELGKFLEYNAINPDQGDVFVLQELAEFATRSPRPFLIVTILHQAIDRYAEHLSPGRRAEWAKVQGRFEDVAFEERTEQTLRLLAHAIQNVGVDKHLKQLRRHAASLAHEAVELGLRSGSMPENELREHLSACYPLHPLVSITLGPLFRQLAQNERSLFAFLASSEPFGFQEYLRQSPVKGSPYRLDQLYDYIMASLGANLFAQYRGKLWAEVQSVLEMLYDASDLEVRLVKTIGILQALGSASAVHVSGDTLQLALKGSYTDAEIEKAIQSLGRQSVVVFRRHTGSYALWEGSDVDIDKRLETARQSVEQDYNLANFLSKQTSPTSLIARRHYFQTGTLRYFDACYADLGDLHSDLFCGVLSAELGNADGRIVYCLPRNVDDREAIREVLKSLSDYPIIVALPMEVFDLREHCHELLCIRWVIENTPELESDRTARREMHAMLSIAEQNLQYHLEWVFSPNNNSCSWNYHGKVIHLSSQRELNDLLSRACDEVYSATPKWRNELINRRSLSSSAAAARRNLIEAMFEHPDQDRLGFQGTPPERSMYETILHDSGLHRKQGGTFGFHPPDTKADPAIREMWKAIEGFLAETEKNRLSVERLFELLRRRPFGLKDGVLPVILAATLVHGHSHIALYEEGTFVPKPNAAVFERLFRSPHKYELQRFRIVGPRAEVFKKYAAMLSRTNRGEPDLLGIVRPLVRMVKDFPDYVAKTRLLSETSQRVLHAVREARQPDRLLFIELPTACGFKAFEATGKVDFRQVEEYFTELRSSFAELQRAYPDLLADIERLITKAFGVEGPIGTARQQIEHEARIVLNVAVDQKLKAFLTRVVDKGIEDTTWLESIATLLAGKPPTYWDDQDRARFEVQLAASGRMFEHFKVLAFEMDRSGAALIDGDPRMLRVSVTVPDAQELERVVQVPRRLQQQANRAMEQIMQVLKQEELLEKKDIGVAVLAELVRQLLSNEDQPSP